MYEGSLVMRNPRSPLSASVTVARTSSIIARTSRVWVTHCSFCTTRRALH
jgi:hypothetical protein